MSSFHMVAKTKVESYTNMKIHGYGSIQPMDKTQDGNFKPNNKCKTWRLCLCRGVNPKTGKPYTPRRVFHGTYTEAIEALKEFSAEFETTKKLKGRKITFEQLCDEWIDERKSLNLIKESSLKSENGYLAALKYQFGKCPIEKLTTQMIINGAKNLMDGDSPSGKKLGGTYVKTVLSIGQNLYRWAIKKGYLIFNPFVDAPRPKNDTKERKALSEDQIEKLISICKPTDLHYVAIMLALFQGLRVSECALEKWKDIDLINGEMLVRGTKTKSSYAKIPILDHMVTYLLEWKEYQANILKEMDLIQDDDTFVLANKFGNGIKSGTLTIWWKSHRDSLGFEGVKFHELRHSFATMLAKKQISPKLIQSLMRHSDPNMALKVYTHVNTNDEKQAINTLNDSFNA